MIKHNLKTPDTCQWSKITEVGGTWLGRICLLVPKYQMAISFAMNNIEPFLTTAFHLSLIPLGKSRSSYCPRSWFNICLWPWYHPCLLHLPPYPPQRPLVQTRNRHPPPRQHTSSQVSPCICHPNPSNRQSLRYQSTLCFGSLQGFSSRNRQSMPIHRTSHLCGNQLFIRG